MLNLIILLTSLSTYAAEIVIQCEGSQYQVIINEETTNNYTLIFTDKSNSAKFETVIANNGKLKNENGLALYEFNKGLKKYSVTQSSQSAGGDINFIIKKLVGKDSEETCIPKW